ncbi:LacI family DNA-binding transcriptional regulator [Streptomyces sp. NPDC049954]|uniref:LacI family DNA-binding transcriptional regulator n=1 Tax=Streptomyces sp. NPDC049954 TaxID=3155779 RepID=UPI003430A19F
MATLKDVARAAGVSVMSVSNVLNGTGRYSAGMSERVLRAVEEVGYAGPDPAAASLRRGRTGTLGVVLPTALENAFGEPDTARFLQGVARTFQRRATTMTLLALPPSAGPLRREDAEPRERVARGPLAALERAVIDAVLLYSVEEDHPGLDVVARRALPVLAVDSPGPEVGAERFGGAWAGFLTVDDHGGALAAARHLVERGHRRAAVLVDRLLLQPRLGPVPWDRALATTSAIVRARLAGYRDAWTGAGLPLDDLLVVECGTHDPAAGRAAVEELLTAPGGAPDAVLALSDSLAHGAVEGALAAGLRVPEDLAVVGYDDSGDAARAPVPLTTVHQPSGLKGETAAALLLDHAAAAPGEAPPVRQLPTRLVVRAST